MRNVSVTTGIFFFRRLERGLLSCAGIWAKLSSTANKRVARISISRFLLKSRGFSFYLNVKFSILWQLSYGDLLKKPRRNGAYNQDLAVLTGNTFQRK